MPTISQATNSEPQPPRIQSFNDLPTEIIQQILYELPPASFLALTLTSKKLHAITSTPLLWRHFCQTEYKYWDPRHNLQQALVRPVEDVPWMRWYQSRRVLDRHVDRLVDALVASARGRIETMDMIVNIDTGSLQGNRDLWDVKDALLRHATCSDKLDDHLARRFWAKATLGKLHRSRAVGIWAAAKDGEEIGLERLMAAFDMFVEGLEDAECADITTYINELVDAFRKEHPLWEEWSTRVRARQLALYLRQLGFKGTQDVFYHNLPNNFIIRCLRDPEHPALPIICVTIYCTVARRLGVSASPCGFPAHVYAVVESSHGRSLDGGNWPDHEPPQRMYIDAFRSEVEVPLSHLRAQLSSMGAHHDAMSEQYLGPASTTEITLRTSRNIMHSVRMAQQRPSRDGVFTDTEGWPDMDVSLYAAMWVSVLFREEADMDAGEQRRRMRHHLPFLCELFQNYFPWDVAMFESHILPMLFGLPEYGSMIQIIHAARKSDSMKKSPTRRGENTRGVVEHKVGQVFRHRRFRYQGVIIGWDRRCDASEEWVEQMGIMNLEKGRDQAFYHVLAEDKSNRYVAQDNIVLTDDEPSAALMNLAGRYFLRYEREAKMFISNIKEEYPDD